MAPMNRVYAARLAGMVVLGPDGESLGRVRDVVISIGIVREQPRVLGLVVEMTSRRSIFAPMLRLTAIEPNAVTLNTANLSLRRFDQHPGEVLVLGQVFGVVKFCFAPAKAELAMERAFTVKALPTSSGVPDGQIVMVRPNDIKAGATSAADGRRVEVFLL